MCLFFICFFISLFYLFIFSSLYTASEIIIPYGIHPFDLCSENPQLWFYIKSLFPFCCFFSHFFILYFIYKNFILKFILFIFSFKKNNSIPIKDSNLFLLIGFEDKNPIYLSESGLYQNFLITGTIGSGKTSSAMYPFTKQLLSYNQNHPDKKIGMLILDAKGNYSSQVLNYVTNFNLEKDFIVISLNSNVYYNPLHKPNLKPQILANRLKTILTLFSENNSDSYWLDKVENILTECIKLCRLYNNNYVTFLELHKLITQPFYYEEKINFLRNEFLANHLNSRQVYDLNSSLNFFKEEYFHLDERTKSILVSEITRITNPFISDFDVLSTFSPPLEKLTFYGFEQIIQEGKIVTFNINISEYTILSKILATYLKLDFQTEVMSFLSNHESKTSAFICDEYDKFCTKTDADFFSLSREAKCINIVSTQSYSSLKHALKDEASVKVILQNLINKIWFRTDDIFTIEEVQKQLGKEEKEKISHTVSENAKETKFNYITNCFHSENSNISESYNTYLQNDFIFDFHFFTQDLKIFSALTFLSDGTKILPPSCLSMIPYFK